MKEIIKNLFVGNQEDYEKMTEEERKNYFVIHACKEPYHRKELGYTGRAAPKEHPEYLIAEREGRLILNLVDVPNPAYIPDEIIEKALEEIEEKLSSGKNVLVHCNQGHSRSPGIALMHLIRSGELTGKIEDIVDEFKSIYPDYDPGKGIEKYVENFWQKEIEV